MSSAEEHDSSILKRLGHALVRWRWIVLLAWTAGGVLAWQGAPRVLEVLSLQSNIDPTMEAVRAGLVLRQGFARPLSDLFAVTIPTPDGIDGPRSRLVLDSLGAALVRQPYVSNVLSYHSTHDSTFLSRDGTQTFIVVAMKVPSQDSLGQLVVPVRRVIHETLGRIAAADAGVLVTGLAPLDLDVRALSERDGKRAELHVLPLTLLVLVLAFGALVAALLPIAIGMLAIWVTLAFLWLLGHAMPMSVFVLNMTTMLGLGMGIDFSLLIVTRFREEMTRGLSVPQAVARATETAGAAVVTSGVIVVVGFLALLLTPLVETRSIGIAGLIVVAVTVALALTLLPALLAVLGTAIDRPRWIAERLAWYRRGAIWNRWARIVSRHPGPALFLGGVATCLMIAPIGRIRIGLPAHGWWPHATEAGQGVETLERMGVGGIINPIRVVVTLPEGGRMTSAASLRGLMQLGDSLRSDPRVGRVRSLVELEPGTSLLGYSLLYSDLAAARAEHGEFVDAYLSRDGRSALVDVLLADSVSLTSALDVTRLARRLAMAPPRGLRGATILVGGYGAEVLDVQTTMARHSLGLVLWVLGVTALILGLVFRSFLVPVKAILMNTLAVGATFGLLVLVFQEGIGGRLFGLPGPTAAVFFLVPVVVLPVVFGLSMDYEVFLLTRMKECFDRTRDNDVATSEALCTTGSTITSAALIMILVFGAFAFARTLAVQFLGFGLATAVLLDVTVIRMILVPALMHLAGRWNWWPGVRGLAPDCRLVVGPSQLQPEVAKHASIGSTRSRT
ncbi:MAG: MMPL family transporter [Gemmatimonadales bacterium]